MSRKQKHIQTAIAVCSIEVSQASSEVQLTPAGEFSSVDGRPHDAPFWFIDAAIAALIIQRAESLKTPYIIDYEHQTLLSEKNGKPAPRAATFSKFEWREGIGLFAIDVQWTKRARKFIESGEYGFISPVLLYVKGTGEVRGFLHAALTNTPAVDGMNEVAALAAKYNNLPQEDNTMDRELLIAMLSLSADASDDDIKSAIAALKQAAKTSGEQGVEITALKQTQFDPAKHIDLATFEGVKIELATLKQKCLDTEVGDLVAAGLEDGRLLPAQKQWAQDLGESNIAALKAYLDTATGIAALKGKQTGGKAPEGDKTQALSETEVAVCSQMGVSPEEYLKNKAEEA